jgi:FkbM family methyltransferase
MKRIFHVWNWGIMIFKGISNHRISDLKSAIDQASLVAIEENLPDYFRRQGKGMGSTTKEELIQFMKFIPSGLEKNEGEDVTFFDIGANVGSYTQAILALLPKASVVAFEPSAQAFSELQKSFGSKDGVILVNAGVGEFSGSAKLYSDFGGSGMGSLTKRKLDHFGVEFNFEEEISITTLDDWCISNNLWPDMIKMDVEGHELEVLTKGIQALKNVSAIQFEFGGCNIDTRTFFQDFWYFFLEQNFRIWRITPSGVFQVNSYSEYDESFVTTNYIAAR